MQLITMEAQEAASSRGASELLSHYAFVTDDWPEADPAETAHEVLEGLEPETPLWVILEAEGWQWMAGLERLEFDSHLFGWPMARITPPGPSRALAGSEIHFPGAAGFVRLDQKSRRGEDRVSFGEGAGARLFLGPDPGGHRVLSGGCERGVAGGYQEASAQAPHASPDERAHLAAGRQRRPLWIWPPSLFAIFSPTPTALPWTPGCAANAESSTGAGRPIP